MLISGSRPSTGYRAFSGDPQPSRPRALGVALKELAQDGPASVVRVSDAHRGGVTWRSTGLK